MRVRKTMDSETLTVWDLVGRAAIGLTLLIGGFVVSIKLQLGDHDGRLAHIEQEMAQRTDILRRISEQLTDLKVAIARLETKGEKGK